MFAGRGLRENDAVDALTAFAAVGWVVANGGTGAIRDPAALSVRARPLPSRAAPRPGLGGGRRLPGSRRVPPRDGRAPVTPRGAPLPPRPSA